ncbi:MAG: hypothetical protein ACYS0E_17185 [Planctomycetota bacterium]
MIGRFLIGFTGVVLLIYAGALVWFSDKLTPGADGGVPGDVILLSVGVTLALSLLHVLACLIAHRDPPRIFFILFVGAVARLILLFGSPGPLLEGDHDRLRFDARLVNRGINPYSYKPSDLFDDAGEDYLRPEEERSRLALVRAELTASTVGPRPEDVVRPDLRSTAMPAALAIGATADRFKPENTRGFVFLVLCADTLAIFLLLMALRALEFPLAWVIVYAWSPVLLRENYCTLGVEAFVLPAMAALVYAIVSGRKVLAGVGTAALMALRPAFLLFAPVLARRAGFVAALLALVLAGSTFLPYLLAGADNPAEIAEGSVHTWRHYEYNSLAENLFRGMLRPVEWSAENTLSVAGVEIVQPEQSLTALLAKVLCLITLLGIVTYLVIRIPDRIEQANHPGLTDLFVTVAAMLLLAPILTPAMTLWLLPVLAVRTFGVAWLALPGLVSLSYLTHLNGPGAADYVLPGTAISYRVLEFGAFGLLLLVDRLRGRQIFPSHAAWEEDQVWQVGAEEDLPYEVEVPVHEHV